jgi:hypothetical protein
MGNGANTKSTQKLPMHHSYASQTQDSYSNAGTKTYKDGNKSGSGGKSRDPDGGAPNATSKGYLNKKSDY